MSEALYQKGGLRFWHEREILLRDQAIQRLYLAVSQPLKSINSAWEFKRMEGTILTPAAHINPSYDATDVWITQNDYALRPETTISSYLYAEWLLNNGKTKLPLCVWQHGKSFRVEANDGAKASELRFNEFYQCEFQCIYRADSKADYAEAVIPCIEKEISAITGLETRIVPSDRLPNYSEKTMDVECFWKGKWKEAASISIRKDYPRENTRVLEIAVGTDRLISMEGNWFLQRYEAQNGN